MITGLTEGDIVPASKVKDDGLTIKLHWDPDSCTAQVRIVPVYAGDTDREKPALTLTAPRHQSLVEDFKADCGSTMVSTQQYREGDPATLLHFGLGKGSELTVAKYRQALTAALRRASSVKCERVVLDLSGICLENYDNGLKHIPPYELGKATAEIAQMVFYQLNHRKSAAAGYKAAKGINLIDVTKRDMSSDERRSLAWGLEVGTIVGRSVNMSRNLVNEPANICTPTFLGEFAAKVGADVGIEVELLNQKACENLGMGSFLAVAAGSNQPPVVALMSWIPPQAIPGIHIVLIGKAVTFDAGGLQIKDGDGMTTMKCDMAGSAAVIGAMNAIAQLKSNVRVTALFGATENMTGGSAMKPLDVVTAMDGQTIEIHHTDAEGRMCLLDMICFARKLGATHIVDLATLTGACMVALGTDTAGLFSNDARLLSAYQRSATSVDEKTWELPVTEKHVELIKSKNADWKNLGPRWAGASTAAALLKVFARDTSWLHVDIAGPAYASSEDGPNPEGGTGYGVRALVAFIEHLDKTRAKWLKRKKTAGK